MTQAQRVLICRRTAICPLATSLVVNLGVGTLGLVLYPAAA